MTVKQISSVKNSCSGNILVVVSENRDGVPEKPGLELLSDAVLLSRSLKCKVICLYFRSEASKNNAIPESLLRSGCHEISDYKSSNISGQNPVNVSKCIRLKINEAIRLILIPQTPLGEDISAHLCGSSDLMWIPDILNLKATRKLEIQICCIAGDNKLTKSVIIEASSTVIGTMKEGIADIKSFPTVTAPEIDQNPLAQQRQSIQFDKFNVIRGYIPPDPATVDITEANKIISAGRGTGGPEGVALTQDLAKLMNASHAASRLVVDSGWVDHSRQVGMTGKTVKPSLYIACGISGASHHLMGMNESSHIIAINSDKKAPIHAIAHLSIVSDLHLIIPDLMTKIANRRKQSLHN